MKERLVNYKVLKAGYHGKMVKQTSISESLLGAEEWDEQVKNSAPMKGF
jgi:hypothetical protein